MVLQDPTILLVECLMFHRAEQETSVGLAACCLLPLQVWLLWRLRLLCGITVLVPGKSSPYAHLLSNMRSSIEYRLSWVGHGGPKFSWCCLPQELIDLKCFTSVSDRLYNGENKTDLLYFNVKNFQETFCKCKAIHYSSGISECLASVF